LHLNDNIVNRPKSVKVLDNFGFVTHNAELIEKVKSIRDNIHLKRPEEPICSAHLYISLTSISSTFGWHKDTTDVFFVQLLGKMKWEIENDYEYILTPGDMIYVEKSIWHNTIPITPRAGVSIGFEL
jgi:mannose-6-phosphate isomerase-like protein (cupin superfamily)